MDAPVNLNPYFARIGYHGERASTLAALHAITRAHAQSIPFENADVLLGRPIRLETAAIFAKLVPGHRGGYCFEQNGLLMQVLRQLGFAVRPLAARVRSGVAERSIPVARTHLVLEVTLDGTAWITDVGVGAASLTQALRLVPDVEQTTPHDLRRLVRADGKWYHQVRRNDAWIDVYEFTGEPMPLIDRTVANWYTSTHPQSKFRRELFAAIALPDGGRMALRNHELTRRAADGSSTRETLADDSALLAALDDVFGIRLPAATRFRLAGAPA